MSIEGELIVRLACSGPHIRQVTVQSTRPMAAARVLKGKTADDAAAMVPRLFSICSGAQGAAARSALAAAGAAGFTTAAPGGDRNVVLETLQDAFWHLLIDWPNAMDSAPATAPVAAARLQIASSTHATDGTPRVTDATTMRDLGVRLSALAEQAIFGMPPAAWLGLADVEALRGWCARRETVPALLLGSALAEAPALGRSTITLMPPPRSDALRRVIMPSLRGDPAFARAPTWSGTPVETGALARMRDEPLILALQRQFGNAVVTRIAARLVELALLLLELMGAASRRDTPPRIQSMPLGEGEGLAAVETARGLLLHHARVHDERVVDYLIVAPTEWNFHPDGALVRGLEGFEAEDENQVIHAARLAVHALDPCVACRVEVGHA